MFKDMKTGPYCRQNCYEREALEPSLVFVPRMTDMEKLLLVEEMEGCLGNPAAEPRFPECLHPPSFLRKCEW